MDVLQFYMPTIKDFSTGLKLALELIRKYLPEAPSAASTSMSSPPIPAVTSRARWRWSPAI